MDDNKVLIDEQNLYDIADAIRRKNGETTKYLPEEMAHAIDAIPTSEDSNLAGNLAIAYDGLTFPVQVGTHCIYDSNYYVCIVAIESVEPFTPAHWTRITAGVEIEAIKHYIHDMSPVATVGPVSVVSVSDAAPLDAEGLVVDIEPVQDLHGYDSPWPAGGGVNKLDPSKFTGNSGFGLTTTISGETFTFSGTCSSGGGHAWRFALTSDADTQALMANLSFKAFVKSGTAPTISAITWNSGFNGLAITVSGLVTNQQYNFAIQIVGYTGTVPTAWTPYSNICPITGWTGANLTVNSNVITITFPSTVGTVYGGMLDVVNGELVVDRAMVIVGIETGVLRNNGHTTNTTRAFFIPTMSKLPGLDGFTSDKFSIQNNSSDFVGKMTGRTANGGVEFYIPATVQDNSEAVQAWFADNPTQLCYSLATTITYQLTPQEISLLRGNNTIYADCGNTTLSYRQDVGLLLQSLTASIHSISP